MSKFIEVTIRERQDGTPGFMKEREFKVKINPDEITLFNKGDSDPNVTFVRLACGITVCVIMAEDKFSKLMDKIKT